MQLSSRFKAICSTLQHHIQPLENCFAELQVQESLLIDNATKVSDSQTFARLERSQLSHDTELLRQALHNLRTEIIEVQNLFNQLTDPTTTALFDALEADLVGAEQQIAALYHTRLEVSQAEIGA